MATDNVILNGDELPTTLINEIGAYNPDVQKKDAELRESWTGEQIILDAFSWVNYLRPQHALAGLEWLENQPSQAINGQSLMAICDSWERALGEPKEKQ